jgi:coenzyme F420 hydrogenase subunit beta
MLKNGIIEQALVCGMDDLRPWETKPILANTEQEIIDSAQSKYSIVPSMRRLGEIAKRKKKTAIVGIPCHIHAFRKYESIHSKLSDFVPYTIGLACHSTLEIEASQKLLEIAGVQTSDIRGLEYRHGSSWPGAVHVILKNGEIKPLHSGDIKSAFNRLKNFYTPLRCLTCIDYSNELADFSVMDPWIRDEKGRYPYNQGSTLTLARNNKALEIIDAAFSDGSIYFEEIEASFLSKQFHSMTKKKKIGSAIRINRLKRKEDPYPRYNLSFPAPTSKEIVQERLDGFTRLFSRWSWTRDLGMRLAFSAVGNLLLDVKIKIRILRYRIQGWMRWASSKLMK